MIKIRALIGTAQLRKMGVPRQKICPSLPPQYIHFLGTEIPLRILFLGRKHLT
jgi:hypothetical protein